MLLHDCKTLWIVQIQWLIEVIEMPLDCVLKVKLLESMKTMDEDAFKAFFGEELMWTATLSNGSIVNLKPGHDDDSSTSRVHFADRLNYISLVKQARMNESQQQVCRLHSALSDFV